jgi:hypothetical protein
LSGWSPPRCVHGRIILGCPRDDCPTQLAYLDQQNAALRDRDAKLWNLPQPEAKGKQP